VERRGLVLPFDFKRLNSPSCSRELLMLFWPTYSLSSERAPRIVGSNKKKIQIIRQHKNSQIA
jgi:hypothetical protein